MLEGRRADMNFLWMIIPVLIAFPLFFLTLLVSIIASRVRLTPPQLAKSQTGHSEFE